MLNKYARAFFTGVFTPVAKALLKMGVSPDAVTLVGTIGVVAGALVFFPRGEFLVGTLVVTAFIFSDLVDGRMARLSGRESSWGAFLDSSLDRLGDAAVFGGLAFWFARGGDKPIMFVVCMACLVFGAVVSYVRARAEGLGAKCDVGIVERSDRLVGSLVATGLCGLGVPWVQPVTLWAIAIGSFVTFVQRMIYVRKQLLGKVGVDGGTAAADSGTVASTPASLPTGDNDAEATTP